MKSHSFRYLFGQGVRGIFRHKLMSFASIGVLTACLVLIGASILTTVNINALVGSAEQENEVIAFLDDFSAETEKEETDKVLQELEKISNIHSISYVSKAQALQEEMDRLGEDAFLLEGLEEDNPYPAHFILTVHKLELLSDTVADISAIPHIYRVNSAENVAKTLISVRNTVQAAGAGIFVALVLVSLVIIANTVRLTVYSRRKEVNIMKMVGATNSFIRMPFMVEGTMLGLFSGLLAFFILWGLYAFFVSRFDPTAGLTLGSYEGFVPFVRMMPYLLPGFLGSGILAGLLGSVASLQKHLNV